MMLTVWDDMTDTSLVLTNTDLTWSNAQLELSTFLFWVNDHNLHLQCSENVMFRHIDVMSAS